MKLSSACWLVALLSAISNTQAMAQASSAGHCLAFDGVDDFVGVKRTSALEPAEITVELWAKLAGPQDWNTRLLRKGEHDAYFLCADQDLDQRMQFLYTRGTTVQISAEDPQPHTAYLGAWHHFLGVYALDHLEFWVDGVAVASTPHVQGAMTHWPLTDLFIGAGLPVPLQNEYFAGRIDEVRIWNYVRTPFQIQSSWNRSVSLLEPGLVAYWKFDEAIGQVALDSSTYVHHGLLGKSTRAEPSDPSWVASDAPILPPDCGGETYCIGAVNSTGHGAGMGWQGSTSLAANDLVLTAQGCPAGNSGLFFVGAYQTQIPFGAGYLCITGPQRFLPVLTTSAAGTAAYAVDFTDPNSPAAHITAGSQWNFQFWYRDPLLVGQTFNFSNALHAAFCP
jgi:hypothetical protein